MKTILINLLGTTLDIGFKQHRWNKWRPSVAICQQDDLVIDDYHLIYSESANRLATRVIEDIEEVSPETQIIPHIINFNDPWEFEEVFGKLLDFSRTLDFDIEKDNCLVHITTGTHVAQICLFLLTEARYFPGKLIQTSPRKKNREDICPGTYSIINLDLSKYDKIASRFKEERDDDLSYLKSGIETKNRHFNAMIEEIEQVAIKSEDPILLTGPTGAGKSRLARKIYDLKHKKLQISGDFVEINCATLKGDNAMSALFGHKKGSYTGAVNDRPGLLKTAHKGIVFLDEIGELGLDEQAMLLRAIEDKCFIPLGSDRETNSDFQLICGTNKNLYENVIQGTFREDLLSRINLWDFTLPGLKERPEDIEPNIKYELSRFASEKGDLVSFNQESYEKFLSFALSSEAIWSSNFRDLSGAVTRMCTLAPGGRINEKIQSEEVKRLRKRWNPLKIEESGDKILSQYLHKHQIDEIDNFDKPQLAYTLGVCKKSKNLSEAGRILYNNSRLEKKNPNDADRLRKYLDRFGLEWRGINSSQMV